MQKAIEETIKKYNLFESNSSIIVAVSGGADSMALLHLMKEMADEYQLRLVVAHVNHKKRENAELDELLVKQVAKEYQLPYEVYYLPKMEKVTNFHAYARKQRYEFFKSLSKKYKTPYLATAHHADDHLETQLHRFIYQTTPAGLIGIEPLVVNDGLKIIRPLIEVSKKEIYQYCHTQGVLFREDESNQSDGYTRNRIRKYIVPQLVKEDASIYAHTRMLSEQLSEDEVYFQDQVDELIRYVTYQNDELNISRARVKELPRSLSRRLIKRILQQFTFSDIQSVHIEEILKLVNHQKPNLTYHLPQGIECVISYDDIIFRRNFTSIEGYEITVSLNEEVMLPTGDYIKISENKVDEKTEKFCINKVHLCYNEIELPLKIRTRRPGDRVELMNGYGSKKVKEIMIESKVPRHLRDSWPIITDARDQIIWIPRLKQSAFCHRQIKGHIITIDYYQCGGNEKDA